MRPSLAKNGITRREFIRGSTVGAIALSSVAILGCRTVGARNGAAARIVPLKSDWLFGEKFDPAALETQFDDSVFPSVTVPHAVAKLSWQNWNPEDWENVWLYRRHFQAPAGFENHRCFVDFEGVMVSAKPVINGQALAEHRGGYLPFSRELTNWLRPGDNVLALVVDSRWQNVPPEGSPRGPVSIDYLEPGGIHRPVSLRVVPQIFISDVFVKPIAILGPERRIEVNCSIDATVVPDKPVTVQVKLMDGRRVVARDQTSVKLTGSGKTECNLTLANLGNVKLWDVNLPHLYQVVATLHIGAKPLHDYRTRIGLREARFETDGFFLNGRRLRLFGLDRHELFPYTGFAMPPRVMRKDAEILKREFNCNAVRCSHYPQSPAFLDACDELGLLVWEEIPGWQYLGDADWQELAVRDTEQMVRRDRNRPSVVIWGVRVNESENRPDLYARTRAAARALDDSRPLSGTMTPSSTKNWRQEWHEDVFAFDDYHSAPDGSVGIREPLPDVPYMLAETVGQFSYPAKKGFSNRYRRAGDLTMQMQQAVFHAQAHDRAAAFPRMAGVIAWCAYDYGSLMNGHDGVKCPGVADIFRIPKLGAAFYRSQVSPGMRRVILPDFYWDFGPHSPRGPGKRAAIFSNCERLLVWIGDEKIAELQPDREGFPQLQYPPFICDLEMDGAGHPELRIDGYVRDQFTTARFSSNPAQDQFFLAADDSEIAGDGSDATRLVFKVVDKFGWERAFAGGSMHFEISGPGILVGDNPFELEASGGVGAVWIRSEPRSRGRILVKATHSQLGSKSVEVRVRPVA